MFIRNIFLLLFLITSIISAAQGQRPIGTWKTFFPYNSAYQVEESEDRIYCASSLAIFYVEKSDNSIHTLDKASGLSDVGIRKIKYNSAAKTLVITYINSNIDLLVNGNTVFNMPEIKNKSTTSSKNINNITVSGKFAYLSTDIGISVVDLESREIVSTYVIGSNGGEVVVNDFLIFQDKMYAATNEGLKVANQTGGNLQDFNNWELQTNGISPAPIKFVNATANAVFAVMNDSVYVFTVNGWSLFLSEDSFEVKQLRQVSDELWISLWNTDQAGYFGKWKKISSSGAISDVSFQSSVRPIDIVANGKYWVADEWSGLVKYENASSSPDAFIPTGPPSSGVFSFEVYDDKLFLASGGTDLSYSDYFYNRDGPLIYENESWKRISPSIFGQIGNCADLLSVAINSKTKKAYYASFQCGLIELDLTTNDVKLFDPSNSSLMPVPGSAITRVTAVCVDSKGNTWMSNANSTMPLVLLKPDGTWKSFSLPYSFTSTRKMLVVNDKIWMCNRPGDIIVYDPGSDLDITSDDKFTQLSSGTGNGALPNNSVWAMAEDKLGDVWVGTEEGIGTFYCAGSVLTTNGCDADKIKVERDGYIGYLFATEIIRSITVDGGNRKWIGTTNGVFLISADGKTELQHFNSENSPLPSNFIFDIKINPSNGEVFIGTELGLVSYQGEATEGGEKKGEALVYPNPVRPEYDGPIAIKGLVDDAYVKITDAAGTLVYQGKALGGQMIWDGKGYEGKRAASGVYIVYAATDLGKERSVAKIVLLN